MNSQTEENYLKALFNLSLKNGSTTSNELSKYLNIKMPTVNSMMKRLADKGLVLYESYKPLRLTEEGYKQAALVIRKHRLTETYLYKMMGFGWEEVHLIAEQVEHIHSPKFFDKMDELLKFPKYDPHGSPIPDKNGVVTPRNLAKLSDCLPADIIIIQAISDSSESFLEFLNNKGLAIGSKLRVDSKEMFDNSMVVVIEDNNAQTLSSVVSEKILVKHNA